MEIFEAFDYLVLLQRGGRLTYFGPLGACATSKEGACFVGSVLVCNAHTYDDRHNGQ